MKICDAIRCKRLALNMNQTELAKILGVSTASISKFERGEELSPLIYNTIRHGVDNYIKTFEPEKYIETRILEAAFSLEYKSGEERLITLNHMAIHINKLALETLKGQARG